MTSRYLALAAAFLLGAGTLRAQSAADQIAAGDKAYTEMRPPAEDLAKYQAALGADSTSYEAAWKAARAAIDAAEFEPDKAKQGELFAEGERYARLAVKLNPAGADGHFQLARALGRLALTKGVKERVKYGNAVYDEANAALKADPDHPGALHVLGRWNAEIMSLSGFERFMAKNILGGGTMSKASWDNAQHDLERAVELDPQRLVHHLDLADIYAKRGMKDKAREQYQFVIDHPATDYNDRYYKQQAAERLRKL